MCRLLGWKLICWSICFHVYPPPRTCAAPSTPSPRSPNSTTQTRQKSPKLMMIVVKDRQVVVQPKTHLHHKSSEASVQFWVIFHFCLRVNVIVWCMRKFPDKRVQRIFNYSHPTYSEYPQTPNTFASSVLISSNLLKKCMQNFRFNLLAYFPLS